MIVPDYWAEAKRRHRSHRKQTTVLRYGWSVDSLEDAQRMADQRADEALRRILSGEKLQRREPRLAYNGAEGTPIREEVLERYGRHVVTRNAYGAHCLNTPDGLFADVDHTEQWGTTSVLIALIGTVAVAAAVRISTESWGFATLAAFFCWIALSSGFHAMRRRRYPSVDKDERRAIQSVEKFVAERPSWNVRIYRTTAGLRLLATHQPFEPRSQEVSDFFDAVGADPVYVQMCRNQNCFRARLTAKPWRIGIESHLRPRPGVWPIREESKAIRKTWINAYEAKHPGFASCHYLASFGSGIIHDSIRDLVDYHDRHSHALMPDLPLA